MPRKADDNKRIQEISRNRILLAAFELFALKGYSETSVDSIAARAKVSKGLIYHYFESKRAILLGLMALAESQLEGLLPSQELPPKKFLASLIDFSFELIEKRPKLNRLMLAMTIQPEVIKGLKKEIGRMRDQWVGLLVSVFTALRYKDPEQEAYLLLATFDGMTLGWLTLGNEYPLKALKKTMISRYKL